MCLSELDRDALHNGITVTGFTSNACCFSGIYNATDFLFKFSVAVTDVNHAALLRRNYIKIFNTLRLATTFKLKKVGFLT